MYSMILFMVDRSDQEFLGTVSTATVADDRARHSTSSLTTPVNVMRWATPVSSA
jgi:hypothetical protein